MKARNENGTIKLYSKIPSCYRSETLNIAGGFDSMDVEVHEQEGFFDVVTPHDFDIEFQKLESIYFDAENRVFTYPVLDKTDEQLQLEISQKLDALDNDFNTDAIKRLLQKVAEPILADEANLTEQDIVDAATLYPQWRGNGVIYKKDKKVVYNSKLYKVTDPHTSQSDWQPDVAVSLFGIYRVPGAITAWVQPTGADGPNYPYYFDDVVTHTGSTWKSTVANSADGKPTNVWAPGVYGWVEI